MSDEKKERPQLSWHYVRGSMGMNWALKLGDKYIGHFYFDADPSIDGEKLMLDIIKSYNERKET